MESHWNQIPTLSRNLKSDLKQNVTMLSQIPYGVAKRRRRLRIIYRNLETGYMHSGPHFSCPCHKSQNLNTTTKKSQTSQQ
jgi:hypothetical protein